MVLKRNLFWIIVLLMIAAGIMCGKVFRNEIIRVGDLDQDKQPEQYIVSEGQLKVLENGVVIWETPRNWIVSDFRLADSNNDGIIDLNLSVWKSGNYGHSKPFWVEKEDMSVRNHFFVLDLVKDSIDSKDQLQPNVRPVWQSSNLSAPNCSFEIKDVDKDGKNELITAEGEYGILPVVCVPKNKGIWKWNGWGFEKNLSS